MTDDIDWSLTTWEGSRLAQHREYLALPFREKLRRLEDRNELAAFFLDRARARGVPVDRATDEPSR